MPRPPSPDRSAQALQAPTCPLCGQVNDCAVASTGSFDAPCWCRSERFGPELLAQVPPDLRGRACICPACARAQDPPRASN